jgi:pyridoxal phosphate enzyme (YggS family)
MESVADALTRVRARIDRACAAAGRDSNSVQLIAVSKTFPVEAVREAHAAGQFEFGENYAQELRDKAETCADLLPPVHWHFIGRVQTNKAKFIAPVAYRVHAIERVEEAEALARRSPGVLHGLVAVNTGGEATKGGVAPRDALDLCERLTRVPQFALCGLMTLPPPGDDPEASAPHFAEVADLGARGLARGLPLHELSMGMSHDFEVAIRHGAHWVRVGSAIFGSRKSIRGE